ncbi:HEPN domain-containing protein [Streptomyces sp. ID05-39B]|uniref:ApeA N-terminal domain 1-containing protein n=1 Tax=Streptomyces sp. ID05-39B TaxID=3028664 RepID=UPI0029C0FA46|nr:HEPN domain-containing protein [Streptomyces sp. ID05-39B]
MRCAAMPRLTLPGTSFLATNCAGPTGEAAGQGPTEAENVVTSRSGVWWAADHPGRRVPGTLVREGSTWSLNLVGTLLPFEHDHDGALSLVSPMTIYGMCLGTRCTLAPAYLSEQQEPGRRYDVPRDERATDDDQHSQVWTAYSFLEGDALPDDALFQAASFELTGLSAWWPLSGFRTRRIDPSEVKGYEPPEPTIADCGNGLTITIWASLQETSGWNRYHSVAERVCIEVVSETGLTLTQLQERVITPLRSLLAIISHRRVECFNLQLRPLDADYPDQARFGYPITVDPGMIDGETEVASDRPGERPTFTADDTDLSSFIPAWLTLAEVNSVPISAAEARHASGVLQTGVVEVVNAAETLHRTTHSEPSDYPFADKVLDILKESERTNRKERDTVYSAVKMTQLRLETRLLQLAEGLGEEFCTWFFPSGAKDWAFVASAIRNALSHGYPTKHRLEHDAEALVGVLRVTQAVIQLRLLVEAGLPRGNVLKALVAQDPTFAAVRHQTVANWPALAATIR